MSRPRRILITGLTGQDGGYLAERLLADDCELIGAVRRTDDALARAGLEEHADRISLLAMDLGDPDSIRRAVAEAAPDEIYHLAAPTFVPDSWREPSRTMAEIAGGTATLLEAAMALGDEVRVLVATSSEIFGDGGDSPQRERSPTRPRSPYGAAKLAAHGLVGMLRARDRKEPERFFVSAITFNHESPRRPELFVTRRVSRGVAAIAAGHAETLGLMNVHSVRDWSHVRDVVEGMVLALRHPTPGDYVFASGVGRTVDELVDAAFAAAGIERRFPDGRDRVVLEDPDAEAEAIPPVGDATKARTTLGWEPRITFEELVAEMVDADLRRLGVATR